MIQTNRLEDPDDLEPPQKAERNQQEHRSERESCQNPVSRFLGQRHAAGSEASSEGRSPEVVDRKEHRT